MLDYTLKTLLDKLLNKVWPDDPVGIRSPVLFLTCCYGMQVLPLGGGVVSHGQPLPLDEGRVWSTDVDLFILKILEKSGPSQVGGTVYQLCRHGHLRL